jgi:hypothetical protein
MPKRKKRKRKRRQSGSTANWCEDCSKIIWLAQGEAAHQIESLKSQSGVRRPELLDEYRCPHGRGWHVGHNYKLKWISLCIGEHK